MADADAEFVASLKAARNAAATRLVEVLSSRNPSYSIDGESVSWETYQAMLSRQIDALTLQINQAEPYEIVS